MLQFNSPEFNEQLEKKEKENALKVTHLSKLSENISWWIVPCLKCGMTLFITKIFSESVKDNKMQ